MKIYKILIVCLLVCTTMQANILNLEPIESEKSECIDKDDLVNRMAEDEDVVSLLGKVYAVNFVKGMIHNQDADTKKEVLETLKTVTAEFQETSKAIKAKFPEYESLSKEERKEVISTIYAQSKTVKEKLKCFGNKCIVAVAGCGGIRITGWALAKFSFCITAAIAVDVEIIIDTGGTATEVIIGQTTKEINFCGRISNALSGPVAALCIAGFAGSLFDCFDIF
ncbi:hypothetical protein C8N46_101679 [Kordia periserrulae]|uniref:Uncharacterized protein n=1 Tax=Kordia periserrulae TaxID=701523 RepID=A0A2T6C6W5_9FLAO|nr:hypothetical protein [Kordia periserrulae]PTX64069.1 hypothetical protein C8N46_101679 [Kordia periserrulae]